MGIEFAGAQGFALLVDPSPEGEVLGDADCGLGVVGDGVQAGDFVLPAPAQQRLVAFQPCQGLRPVDAGTQEGRDGGGVARAGEVQQRGLGSAVGVVLVLTVSFAAGTDDLPVLVAPEVDLALAVGEGAGGELLDESFVMTAESLYLREGCPVGTFGVVEPAVVDDQGLVIL